MATWQDCVQGLFCPIAEVQEVMTIYILEHTGHRMCLNPVELPLPVDLLLRRQEQGHSAPFQHLSLLPSHNTNAPLSRESSSCWLHCMTQPLPLNCSYVYTRTHMALARQVAICFSFFRKKKMGKRIFFFLILLVQLYLICLSHTYYTRSQRLPPRPQESSNVVQL